MNKNIVLDYYELFNLNISALGLSVRYYNALLMGHRSKKQIKKVGDLVALSSTDLLRILNIGEVGAKEIKDRLHHYRLYLFDETIPNGIKISYERALNMYNLKDKYDNLKKENNYEEIFSLDILVLKLDYNLENALKTLNISTIGELITNKNKVLTLGRTFSKIIIDKLHNLGLDFVQNLEEKYVSTKGNKIKKKLELLNQYKNMLCESDIFEFKLVSELENFLNQSELESNIDTKKHL